MRPTVLVIGAGKIGRFLIQHLPQCNLIVVDRAAQSLEKVQDLPSVAQIHRIDTAEDLVPIVSQATPQLALSCVPGDAGYEVAKTVLQQGVPVVDVSFMPEDAFSLLEVVKTAGTWYIPDAGIAPGFSNLFAGWSAEQMAVEEFRCYVGGLPQHLNAPLYYEAPFHIRDALAEYVRPARLRHQGRNVAVHPLSVIEYVDQFRREAGILAAFYTDGLRTLLQTLPDIPTMEELTLRYRPHLEIMRTFADLDLLTPEKLPTLAEWLQPFVTPQSADMTLLWCEARNSTGEFATVRLVDYGDEHHPSMTKVTGTVALSVVEALLPDPVEEQQPLVSIEEPGVYPLELLPQLFDRVVEKLVAAGADLTVECSIQ